MGGQVLTSEGKTCSLRTSFTNGETKLLLLVLMLDAQMSNWRETLIT